MKTIHQEIHRKRASRRAAALPRFLRYLNTRTLAVVLFVTLALFSNTHGKNTGPRKSMPPDANERVIRRSSFFQAVTTP